MVCMQTTIQGEGFELFIKPRLRGNRLHYPGHGFMRGHRQMAWGVGGGGEETEKGQATSLPGSRGFHY